MIRQSVGLFEAVRATKLMHHGTGYALYIRKRLAPLIATEDENGEFWVLLQRIPGQGIAVVPASLIDDLPAIGRGRETHTDLVGDRLMEMLRAEEVDESRNNPEVP